MVRQTLIIKNVKSKAGVSNKMQEANPALKI